MTLVLSAKNYLLKVCPTCQFTAHLGDPICPQCNHIYPLADVEEMLVEKAVQMLKDSSEKKELIASSVVFSDEVEGVRVTEGDIAKCLHKIGRFIPRRK